MSFLKGLNSCTYRGERGQVPPGPVPLVEASRGLEKGDRKFDSVRGEIQVCPRPSL